MESPQSRPGSRTAAMTRPDSSLPGPTKSDREGEEEQWAASIPHQQLPTNGSPPTAASIPYKRLHTSRQYAEANTGREVDAPTHGARVNVDCDDTRTVGYQQSPGVAVESAVCHGSGSKSERRSAEAWQAPAAAVKEGHARAMRDAERGRRAPQDARLRHRK